MESWSHGVMESWSHGGPTLQHSNTSRRVLCENLWFLWLRRELSRTVFFAPFAPLW